MGAGKLRRVKGLAEGDSIVTVVEMCGKVSYEEKRQQSCRTPYEAAVAAS